MKPTTTCKACGHTTEITPDDIEIARFKRCGLDFNGTEIEKQVATSIYKKHKLENSWFSGWFAATCDICNEPRVLGWADGCSPSGISIIHPSSEIRFWPGYDYPNRKIQICKWCHPDSENPQSQNQFLENLINAMRTENARILKWKEKNPR